ncbi:MAG: family 10 glycosylhydrolase [Planctomycetes bacterium]|nr:family 10 glycosylhydrolase [Planctomycetota bacterium]
MMHSRGALRCGMFVLLMATACVAPAEDSAKRTRAAAGAHRLVLCNDGGTLAAPDMEGPIGAAGLIRSTIDPLRDTMIDTLYWQLGTDPYKATLSSRLSDWYSHDTKIGPRWGDGIKRFDTAGEWRVYATTQQLIEQGQDPPALLIREGHKAGIAVYLSLRFNDTHDHHLPDTLNNRYFSPMKREHPQWLLGEKDWRATSYNFAVPQVRAYRMALIEETIDKYDLDGLNLDFCRFPYLFKTGEAERGKALITEMIRKTHARIEAKRKTAGRKVGLSVRVPGSLAEGLAAGIDTATWMREGLVDYVIVGAVQGWEHPLPIGEYRKAAEGTQCHVLAQNLDAFMEPRPRSAAVLFGEKNYNSTEKFRAAAAVNWARGAEGILIWNQHFIPFLNDAGFDRQNWKEIGDPATLARLDKHYTVCLADHGGSMPLKLEVGEPAKVNIEIADDLPAARRDKALASATLRLLIEQLTGPDDVTYQLNGQPLDPAQAVRRINYNDTWLDFDVANVLRNGDNELVVTVRGRNASVAAPLSLRSVETLVKYR